MKAIKKDQQVTTYNSINVNGIAIQNEGCSGDVSCRAYVKGDLFGWYSSTVNTVYYRCILDAPSGTDLTNTTYFEKFSNPPKYLAIDVSVDAPNSSKKIGEYYGYNGLVFEALVTSPTGYPSHDLPNEWKFIRIENTKAMFDNSVVGSTIWDELTARIPSDAGLKVSIDSVPGDIIIILLGRSNKLDITYRDSGGSIIKTETKNDPPMDTTNPDGLLFQTKGTVPAGTATIDMFAHADSNDYAVMSQTISGGEIYLGDTLYGSQAGVKDNTISEIDKATGYETIIRYEAEQYFTGVLQIDFSDMEYMLIQAKELIGQLTLFTIYELEDGTTFEIIGKLDNYTVKIDNCVKSLVDVKIKRLI